MNIRFGKHKGKTVKWVVENDKQYAEWLASIKSKNFNKTKNETREAINELKG